MTYLVRKVRKPDLWVDVEPGWADLPDHAFPARLLLDVLDPQGRKLSFWEVDNAAGALFDRMVAALVMSDKQIKEIPRDLGLRIVPRNEIEAAGLELQNTPGDSLDTEFARNYHRDIAVSECGHAVKLAKLLVRGEAKTFTRPQLTELVMVGLKLKRFDLKPLSADFVKHLFNAGKLVIN